MEDGCEGKKHKKRAQDRARGGRGEKSTRKTPEIVRTRRREKTWGKAKK